MNTSVYRDELLEHYRFPHNAGTLAHPTHRYDAQNPSCGDNIILEVEVQKGVIKNIAHTTTGCALTVASASILSEEVMGKTVKEAHAITPQKLTEMVVGTQTVSPSRLKCILLPLDALTHALRT